MTPTLDALIEKVAAAKEPSRELDGLIYGAVNNLKRNGCTFILDISGVEHFQFEHPTLMHPSGPGALYVPGGKVSNFSESIDAALTLVPEDWSSGYLSWPGYDNGVLQNNARAEIHHIFSSGGGPREIAFASTLPLALCLAALRAMRERGATNNPGTMKERA